MLDTKKQNNISPHIDIVIQEKSKVLETTKRILKLVKEANSDATLIKQEVAELLSHLSTIGGFCDNSV